MINSIAFLILLSLASPQDKADKSVEEHLCGEAMGIYLPEPQGVPAPNIKLMNFQYMSPDDRCGRNIPNEELMKLHAAIKPIAAAAFGDSPNKFSVMVRYTLTPDKPAIFDMQVMDAGESDKARLTKFYEQSAELIDFHSSAGTVYVVFNYAVSPSAAIKPGHGG